MYQAFSTHHLMKDIHCNCINPSFQMESFYPQYQYLTIIKPVDLHMKLGSRDMDIRQIAHRAIVPFIRHLSVSDHLRRSNEGEVDHSCYVCHV